MALTYATNQYTIPRGRVFFNPKDAQGEFLGEIYLGNCPSFGISIETEKAEHYSSETGLRQKDASVLLEVKRNGTLTCDNMSHDNVALFLSGTVTEVSQSEISVAKEETLKVMPGRYYPLGVAPSTPAGVRNVTDVVVTGGVGPTTYQEGADKDYVLDAQRGIIQIVTGGGIEANDEITVEYKAAAVTYTRVMSGSTGELVGALRIASDNATGGQRDYYMPNVSLLPSGELPVIAEGTDFASMQFDADVLKPANGEAIYVDGTPVTAD